MICLLAGEPGVGKSFQAMLFEEIIKVFDLENRDKSKLSQLTELKNRLIEVIEIKQIKPDFKDDYLQSYYKLQEEIDFALKNNGDFETLLIDGISDIRNKLALAKWHKDNPKRKRPNVFEWGTINETTKNMIAPLINMSRVLNKNLILTAQLKDDYGTVYEEDAKGNLIKKSAKCGRTSACPDFIDYDVDIVIDMYHPERGAKGLDLNKFMINVTKSPIGSWTQDITNQSLYDILIEKGL